MKIVRIATFLGVVAGVVLWAGAASAAGMPTSASKVAVSVGTVTYAQAHDALVFKVTLAVAKGWHVNAHPASLPFLIATDITLHAGQKTLDRSVAWPAGRDSGIEFNNTALKVYNSNTVLPVTLPASAAQALTAHDGARVDVRVQACSDKGICLPPSTLRASLDAPQL